MVDNTWNAIEEQNDTVSIDIVQLIVYLYVRWHGEYEAT